MADDNKVILEFTVESDGAVKDVKKFETEVKKSVDKTESAFSGLKVAIAAAVAFLASKAIVNGLKDIIDEASKADQNVRDLANALAITGEFSDKAVKNFTDFASALQRTTTNTDDAILQALALAKTFGITNDQAQKLVSTSVDLAAATGKDLNSAVQELGATYSGTAGRLGKVTPALKDLTESQLKNGEAIDIVSKKFKGFAEASSGTFSGALTITKNGFGEIFESLGKIITQNPVAIASIKALGDAFFKIADFIDQNKESITELLSKGIKEIVSFLPITIRGFALLAEGLNTLTGVIGNAVKGFVILYQSLIEVTKPIRDLENILGNTLLAALSKFIASFIYYVDLIPGAASAVAGLGINLDELRSSVNKFGDDSLDKALALDTSVSDSYTKFVNEATVAVAEFTDSTQTSFSETFDAIEAGANKIADVAQVASDSLQKVGNSAVKVTEGVKNATKDLEGFDLTKFLKDTKVKLDVGTEGVTGALTAANGILDTAQGLIDSIPSLLGKVAKIFNSLTDLPGAILSGIQSVFKAIPRFISEFLPNLLKAIPEIIVTVLDALANAIPDAIIGLAEALPDIIVGVIEKLADIAAPFIEALITATPRIVIGLVDALITNGGIVRIATALIVALTNPQLYIGIAKGILSGLVGLGSQISNQFKAGITGVGSIFGSEFVAKITAPFANFINGIRNAFTFGGSFAFSNISSAFTSAIAGLYQGIINAFSSVFGSLFATISGAFTSVFGGIFGTITGAFYSIIDSIYGTITGAFNNSFDGIRNALGDGAARLRDEFFKPVNALKDFLNQFKFPKVDTGTGSGGGSGIISETIDRFSHAKGALIPPGFKNDTYPANLSSGELVLPPDISSGLLNLISNPQQQQSTGLTEALLVKILNALQSPQQVNTQVVVGSREIANVILDLQRNNQRLSA